MRATKIEIRNFKRFDSADLDLSGFDCLVGTNNSGKSTVLQALSVFDYCSHRCLERRNGDLTIQPRTDSPDEFVALPFADPALLWTDGYWRRANSTVPIEIVVFFGDYCRAKVTVKLNMNRLGVTLEVTPESEDTLRAIAEFKAAYLPVFSSFAPREERRTPAVLDDELSRGRIHGVVRNLLVDLKNAGKQDNLEAVLRSTFPDLEGIRIAFDEVTDRYITVSYREKGRRKELDLFSQGSGFQQLVYLFGFLLLKKPNLALLDEPDVHLHGGLQAALIEQLRGMSRAGTQVVIATHSRDIIERLRPHEMIWLDGTGIHRFAAPEHVFEALEQLGSLQPQDVPKLKRFARLLLVENKQDYRLLATMMEKCLGIDRWRDIERRLAVAFSQGNPRKKQVDWLREQIQRLVGVGDRPLEVFVVADRDYCPEEATDLSKRLESEHVCWHVWERTEIENYLLDPGAIARLVGTSTQLTIDERLLRQEYEDAIQRSKERAQDRLVKAFDELSRERGEARDLEAVSRRAREFLEENWASSPESLADAKEIVLPAIRRWLQSSGFGSFSDSALAASLLPEELPEEVHALTGRLAAFVDMAEEGRP